MARRKKESGQAELGADRQEPRPTMHGASAEVAEYQPLSTEGRWRVESWELLAAEVVDGGASAEGAMPIVHEALRRFARSWLIVRRLFGVMPVVLDLKGDPEDYRRWSRAELASHLGIGLEDLQQELLAARAVVQRALGKGEEKALAGPEWEANAATSNAHLQQGLVPKSDEEYLREMGYAPRMFEIQVRNRLGGEPVARPREENELEKRWFAGRVRQFEKVLKDRMVSRLADQVLRNELRLKRAEDELTGGALVIGGPDYDALMKVKADLEKTFERQLAQLAEAAPWFNATEKEMAAKDAFSEVVRAIQEYQARGETRLINGLFTAYEMQVLVRTSVQKPEPDYRLGWHLHVLESRSFLWDAHGRSKFRQRDLQKLDRGFKEAVRRYVDESGEAAPDLMRQGEGGEFEEIYMGEANAQGSSTHDQGT